MKHKINLVPFLLLMLLLHSCFVSVGNAATVIRLEPLFEMQVGREADQFLLTFLPAPFAPSPDLIPPLYPLGKRVLVDNHGNFYLLREGLDITKVDSRGQVVGRFEGINGYTRPMEMMIDRNDNLYVKFRNETDVVEEFRYAVARFDKDGDVQYLIGDDGRFSCLFMDVNINGTIFLRECRPTESNRFRRYTSDGSFTGIVRHAADRTQPWTDAGGHTSLQTIGYTTIEGADGYLYVVNEHDLSVTKHSGTITDLADIEQIEPLAERQLFPWKEIGSKPNFDGLDTDNNMYFYFGPWKRGELPEYHINVSSVSDTLVCCRYDFETDEYDTSLCYHSFEPEGKFLVRSVLRNSIGQHYELVVSFNYDPHAGPEGHARFYKWVPVD